MARLLERLLNLRRGDLSRGALLFAYLLLIIASYVVGKVVRNALFLGQFNAVKLPYFILVIAVLTGIVVAGYVRIGRGMSLRNLLAGSLLFFAANCVLFWWVVHFYKPPWLYPVVYVWVGIFGVLAPAQVWTLANYVLTTREAKRLFGLIGSGAISGWIFGGFIAQVVQQQFGGRYGTEVLLVSMGLFLAVCAVLVVFIWQQGQTVSAPEEAPQEALAGAENESVWESLKLVASSRYLQAISGVICLSSVVTTVAGWQLDAIAQATLVTEERIGLFYADFYFYAALASLATQLLLTSRVLRHFGIGPALFVVPVALLFGEAGILVWGNLAAAVVLKGSDQVLRYSIDKSGVELLYLPVPARIKLQVKSFIDTAVWRFGDGLAALALLAFATWLGWSAAQVAWVNLVFIGGWLLAAFLARQQYVHTLRESIREYRLDAERAVAPVLDRAAIDLLAKTLCATDPKEILYALSLLESERRRSAHPAVRDLLKHPAPEVRARALSLLADTGDRKVLPEAERLLHDPSLEVRTEALLCLTRHAQIDPVEKIQSLGDFPDFSIRAGIVAFLARPGDAQNLVAARTLLDAMVREAGEQGRRTRLEAARLLSILPPEFDEQLRKLLEDADKEVVREAVRAVGNQRRRVFVPRVLRMLADADLASDAAEALARFGDRIVGTLRDHLTDPDIPADIRRQIPGVLARIATPAAARVLVNSLLEEDPALRFRIIAALNKLRQLHPEISLDEQMIETVLTAEIMGHYRAYQILGTLGGELDSDEPVVRALRESMREDIERIFRLLALLFPNYDFHSAYVGLHSKNPVVHDNALEFLENILRPQLRSLLVPLLDSEVSVSERIRRANRMVGGKIESREEAVAALLASEDPWVKSCGAYAAGVLGLRALEPILDTCLSHPDPLLRETVRQAKLRLAAAGPRAAPAAAPAARGAS